jgi:ParB family chromosome partitioning protein
VAKPRPGMGRGLDAILSVSSKGDVEPREEELRELPVALISPSPNQPRRTFDEEALQALAGSLGSRGVLQPVLVRPRPGGKFELVAGERRWRAATLAGLETIPALVRDREDAVALEIALVENMAREDLNPIEEARACAALVEELGLTREEGHGRALLLADDHVARRTLARDAADQGWSVRLLEQRARETNSESAASKDAPRRKAVRGVHPDQEHAAREIADLLSGALGVEVEVKPSRDGRYRAELSFSDLDEAGELARRIGSTTIA